MTRDERIEDAICSAGLLIAELMKLGPVNPEQADLIISATVRAKVPNAERFEIFEAARRIVADLGKQHARSSPTRACGEHKTNQTPS